jgi:hypothetical protein
VSLFLLESLLLLVIPRAKTWSIKSAATSFWGTLYLQLSKTAGGEINTLQKTLAAGRIRRQLPST